MLIKAFSKPKIYMLGDNEITSSTTTINNKTISIPYTDITEFKTTNVVNTRQLLIKSHHGKITIADMNFEYKSDFDEIVRTISQKIRM